MRPSRSVRALLLAALGLALLANAVWLFPNEGHGQYTYDRTAITVENGTFAYRGSEARDPGHEYNDLVPVACDAWDGDRTCAFDQYLAANGPATVADDRHSHARPAFVRIDGHYYNRTATHTENGTVYDVRRIAPRDLLAAAATDLTGATADDVDGLSIQTRVAVTGESASTAELPDREDVGRVYRRDGTYYTVVVVDEGTIDTPVFADWMRTPISVVGMALLVVALLVGVGDHETGGRSGVR